MKKLLCAILMAVTVTLGAAQLNAAQPTTQPAKKPPKPTVKAYRSLAELLKQVPVELTKGDGEKLTATQCSAINNWIARNMPAGSTMVYRGEFAASSASYTSVQMSFRPGSVTMHGKKLRVRANADLERKYAAQVAKLRPGKRAKKVHINRKGSVMIGGTKGSQVTINGRIASLTFARGEINLRLDNAGLGQRSPAATQSSKTKPSAETKPKATTAPAHMPKIITAADPMEVKASRSLRLAKTYLGFGKKEAATAILEGVVKDYPKTKAAKLAAVELKKLKAVKDSE